MAGDKSVGQTFEGFLWLYRSCTLLEAQTNMMLPLGVLQYSRETRENGFAKAEKINHGCIVSTKKEQQAESGSESGRASWRK